MPGAVRGGGCSVPELWPEGHRQRCGARQTHSPMRPRAACVCWDECGGAGEVLHAPVLVLFSSRYRKNPPHGSLGDSSWLGKTQARLSRGKAEDLQSSEVPPLVLGSAHAHVPWKPAVIAGSVSTTLSLAVPSARRRSTSPVLGAQGGLCCPGARHKAGLCWHSTRASEHIPTCSEPLSSQTCPRLPPGARR